MSVAAGYPGVLPDEAAANGVAQVVVTLVGQNLESFPDRIRIARRMRRPVAIHSLDTSESTTLMFEQDRFVVHNGILERPSVTVKSTVSDILDVSQLPMKAGGLLPVGFFTKRGLRVLGRILRGRLVVRGLLPHPITALRLIALVSVVE